MPLGVSAAVGKVVSSQDAATLAAEEVAASHGANGVGGSASLAGGDVSQLVLERPARFTTVEEEEETRRTAQRRSWLAVAAPWAVLVVLIYILASVFRYFSRPPTADQLYQAIATRAEADDASRGDVASAVNEFLKRFPGDSRVEKLQRIREEIDLDKLERKLQRQVRGSGLADPSLLDVERMYLHAQSMKDSSPDTAAHMLESIIALYGPVGTGEPDAQVTAVVQLASRRLKSLREDLTAQHAQHVKSLQERLDAAERLSATDAKRAAAIYQAIVDLHQNNDWAKAIVEEAQARLDILEKSTP
jgi:hypothetical protein